MFAITKQSVAQVEKIHVDEDVAEKAQSQTASMDWASMYTRQPSGMRTLFELEAVVAKRMDLLAWIDQLANSPKAPSFDAILDSIIGRLPQERRRVVVARGSQRVTLGQDDAAETGATPRMSTRSGSLPGVQADDRVVFFEDEDLLSHQLSRYAFCMNERWRKWFVKTEETLLRARLKMQLAKQERDFLPWLMKTNGLPCEPLRQNQLDDERFAEYLKYRATVDQRVSSAADYFSVPTSLATRLIKTRAVLCLRGFAILHRDQAQEVFVTVFRGALNRGLHEAYLARTRLLGGPESPQLETVTSMLDAFLEHYVADPTDQLAEGAAGTVRPQDVKGLAQTHFPLCMRRIDDHLRANGHLKHHGRFMYGLFLKSIGLSLDDAMELFSSLMVEKGGGSVEAFSKTAYGYNVRHNYGMEGRKMSYNSLSCGTVLGLPPMVDRQDCHGCPFRFQNESALRATLQAEQRNPCGSELSKIRPTAADIEDIVTDCKGQHYTRACYKYFVATHPGCRRDTLFRSPYEYFTASIETSANMRSESSSLSMASTSNETTPHRPSSGRDSMKRTMFTPTLKEDVIRQRTSP